MCERVHGFQGRAGFVVLDLGSCGFGSCGCLYGVTAVKTSTVTNITTLSSHDMRNAVQLNDLDIEYVIVFFAIAERRCC
jgi:hypothetical protein